MAELKWKTPVPQPGFTENDRTFTKRLLRWLGEQEQPADYCLEEYLAFGGIGVASRIFGFEGLHSGYGALVEQVIKAAPSGSNKHVIVGLHVSAAGSSGDFEIVKRKTGFGDAVIMTLETSVLKHEEIVGGHKSGYITLDAEDELIVVKPLSGATDDFSWSGSFIDVE